MSHPYSGAAGYIYASKVSLVALVQIQHLTDPCRVLLAGDHKVPRINRRCWARMAAPEPASVLSHALPQTG